ncbi:MAG: hypothetical protein ACPGUD_06540 [Parashewanella sp.]
MSASYQSISALSDDQFSGLMLKDSTRIAEIALQVENKNYQLEFSGTKAELDLFHQSQDWRCEVGKFEKKRPTSIRLLEFGVGMSLQKPRRFTYGTCIVANVLLKDFHQTRVAEFFAELGEKHKHFVNFIKSCELTNDGYIVKPTREFKCDSHGLSVGEIIYLGVLADKANRAAAHV